MIHQHELDRIEFLTQRDGIDSAMVFVNATYKTYRKALMQSRKRGYGKPGKPAPHHATLPEYRRSFIESCVTFRHFIQCRFEHLTS